MKNKLTLFFQFGFFFFSFLSFTKNINLGKCFINICIKKHIWFSSFMPTLTSYFGFLLAALTITSALFIGLSKIRLIWKKKMKSTIQFITIKKASCRIWCFFKFVPVLYFFYCDNFEIAVIAIHGQLGFKFKDRYYLPPPLSFQKNWNDWSTSIWNRLRFDSYYFGWIIRNCIFTI